MCVKRWMASEAVFITRLSRERERNRRWSGLARFNNIIIGEKWEPFILFPPSISQCHWEPFSNRRFNQGNGNAVKNFSLDQSWEKLLVSGAKLGDGGLALYGRKVCNQLVINQCGRCCQLFTVKFQLPEFQALSNLYYTHQWTLVFKIYSFTLHQHNSILGPLNRQWVSQGTN